MKNTFICLLFVLWLPALAFGQSEDSAFTDRHDELLEQIVPEALVARLLARPPINTHITGSVDGWFDVTCDFSALPQPLVPAKATITFTVTRHTPETGVNEDWIIVFSGNRATMDWLSGDSIIWHGSKAYGSTYQTDVQFIPLCSGSNGFAISLGPLLRLGWAVRIAWCLDGDGNLLSLCNPRLGLVTDCDVIHTIYFSTDSVVVGRPGQSGSRHIPFSGRYTITPPLRIGDTSTIRYSLTANRDMPDGIDYRFSTVHMKIVQLPEGLIDCAIAADETVELTVDVVPAAVRNVQVIDLQLGLDLYTSRRTDDWQSVHCEAIFNDDGSLRYIYTRGLGAVDESLYPRTFPEAETDGAWRSRLFRKDGPPPDSTDLR